MPGTVWGYKLGLALESLLGRPQGLLLPTWCYLIMIIQQGGLASWSLQSAACSVLRAQSIQLQTLIPVLEAF